MNHLFSRPIYTQLHHVAIQVRNLKTSVEFYQNLFQLQIERQFFLDEEEIIWLQGDGWRLELITIHQRRELDESSSVSPYHFAIEVPNLTDWEQLCHQLRIKIIEGPFPLADGTKILFIEGPDKEQIEFIQPNPTW